MAVYVPDMMNQFYRLTHVSGPKGTGYYTAGDNWDNYHRNPSTGRLEDYDSRNCTATMGAVLRDAHTGGISRSSPVQIRNHQGDWAGGIGWDDVNDAWWDIWGERLTIPSAADWYDVLAWLKQGRHVGIQGDYDQVPYAYQAQKGGTFDHAFSLGGYNPSNGQVLLFDPLARKAQWVPQYAIRPAAEKLALAQRGTRSRLFVMITQVMPTPRPPQTSGWRASVQPIGSQKRRSYWRYILDRSATYIVDREAHETGGWSARCTAPVIRKVLSTKRDEFPQASYSLVKINDSASSYNGWWIAAGYAQEV